MRILAVITARGGSKRLPKKNIRILGGHPLIAWSISVVKDVIGICDILISTDDLVIKDIAKFYGGYVPFLRPNELSTDSASSVDTAVHALDWYEQNHGPVDGLMLIQPTSPFRRRETVEAGIELFRDTGKHSVLGVSPAMSHPSWTFKIERGFLEPFLSDFAINTRSQDLEPAYVVNGSFYLISSDILRQQKSFVTSNTVPLIMDSSIESLDIDNECDWEYAEYCIQKKIILWRGQDVQYKFR